jgi:D-methionine transport system substrate-binding protein
MSFRTKTGLVAVLLAALALVSGSVFAQNQKLVFGVAPGPYGDLIRYAIKPFLEKKGYTIEIKEFSDYVQPNLALNNGDLDANLFQHVRYLKKFSVDKGLNLTEVITIPTAGLGIYSRKVTAKNADDLKTKLKKGDTITLANDPTNLARALGLLQKHGLITLKGAIDPTKASEKDIDQNPYGLVIQPIEAAQLPRLLDSVTLSVVNGNYAIAAGIPLSPSSATAARTAASACATTSSSCRWTTCPTPPPRPWRTTSRARWRSRTPTAGCSSAPTWSCTSAP